MEMPKNFKRTSFSAYMFVLCLFLFVSTSVEVATDYSTPLSGSTPGLAYIFIGRCFDYLRLYKDLKLHPDEADEEANRATFCQETWEIFKQAFAGEDICQVKPEAYIPYLEKTGSTEKKPVTDKLMLWSGTFELSGQYANHGQRVVTLADTLTGYLVTNLNWCGGTGEDGINYDRCTRCKTSEESTAREGFEVFWGIASESFARRAVGLVRHLVNGTGILDGKPRPAFDTNTFFYKHELPNLNVTKVTNFRVILANRPKQSPHEHCNAGSLLELQKAIEEHGKLKGKTIPNECVENPIDVLHFMCVDASDAKECAFKSAPPTYSQKPAVSYTELFKKFFQRKQEPKPVKK